MNDNQEQNNDLAPILNQYHCTDLKSLKPKEMCANMAPGFYIRNKSSFQLFKNHILEMKQLFKNECIFSV